MEDGTGGSPQRREEVRADLDGQGGESHEHHGREQADLRDDHTDVQPSLRHGVRGGPLRKRAGEQRQCDPAVQEADRGGGTCDSHPPGYHPLFHDDPGGGVARAAGGRLRKGRGDFRPRYGGACQNTRSGREPDPSLRVQGRRGYQDRIHGTQTG